ncbi:YabP/YqfC family sporulation protein [Pumilibacter muris]|uniref:YabP/YqfC family sporulation protein n=1 Tax=Pumilibacter muris TaxID=2941510 RepID=UPI0020422424|nr:YabP/YqfC family sporulation protein [Pumilibacter muris]
MDEARLALGYNYVNYNGEAVYLEGIQSVLRIDGEEIAFRLKRGVLYVTGEELTVSDLCGASVLVRGKIAAVETGESRNAKAKREKEGGDAK